MAKELMAKGVGGFYGVIAENIIRLRGKMSQDELAKKSGVSRGTIGKVEAGRGCSIAALYKLAMALGVNPGDLCISKDRRDELSMMAAIFVERIMEQLPEEFKGQLKK